MNNMYRKTLLLIFLLESLLLTGCFNFKAKDDPTRFYILSSVCQNQKYSCCSQVIGVTRVVIPDYLDRCKIVIEVQQNEFKIAEFDCWAEAVDRGVTRVITENLSAQLTGVSVLPAPWRGLAKPDLELHVHLLEFKPQLFKCETSIRARYYITSAKADEVVQSHELCIAVPIIYGPDCYLNIVASMNEALALLSLRIADNLCSIK